MERIRAVYPLPSDDQTSEQGQDERSLGGPSDPLDPQEAPSEAGVGAVGRGLGFVGLILAFRGGASVTAQFNAALRLPLLPRGSE